MTGVALVEEIVSILVAGITGIASGIGEGLSTLASAIFFTTAGDTTGLSVLGVCIVAFAGISLAKLLVSINRAKSVKTEMSTPSKTNTFRKGVCLCRA